MNFSIPKMQLLNYTKAFSSEKTKKDEEQYLL